MQIKKMSLVIKDNMPVYENKIESSTIKMITLGILAGGFIAIGASSSSAAVFGIANIGLAKFLAGCIFPVGLILIVLVGGELFTGNCLLFFGVLNKKVKIWPMLKVLIIVFFSNLVGTLVVVFLVNLSGQLDFGDGALGAYVIETAYAKLNHSFVGAFSSGIMCNILVCIAVLLAGTPHDVIGQIWAIFFPTMAFVVGGFEHCVANMYYISAGLLAKYNDKYYNAALESGMTPEQIETMSINGFLVDNLLPVTLGNIIGGMFFVALPLYLINRDDISRSKV